MSRYEYIDPSDKKIAKALQFLETVKKLLAVKDLKNARQTLRNIHRLLKKEECNEAEIFVAKAAQFIIARNPFFVEYIAAEKNGELDARGIDGILRTRTSKGILIQVKSNEKDVEFHYSGGMRGKRVIKPHGDTIAIAPRADMDAEEFSYKLEEIACDLIKYPMRSPEEWYNQKKKI